MVSRGWRFECQVCGAIALYGASHDPVMIRTKYGERHPCKKCYCLAMALSAGHAGNAKAAVKSK